VDRKKILLYIDGLILAGLLVLVVFLPIAHTETIRALAMGIPMGLWLMKMILSRRWLFSRTPLDWPILLFTVVAALSVFTAIDPRYSLEEFIGEWLTGVLLFYLVVNNLRSEQLKYLLGALFLGNAIMVTYGLYEFFHAGGQLLDYQIRAKSLHSGFGTFSTYLVTVLPYVLAAFFVAKGNFRRGILLLFLFLNLFCLYLTHTRGAWVSGVLLLILAGWKFIPKRVFLPLLAAGGIGFLIFAPQGVLRHTAPVTGPGAPTGKMETGDARWELTKFSLKEIAENPFRMLGFGRRSFVKQYRDFHARYQGVLLWHAHNTFLDIALQTGVQGLLFFVILLYKMLKHCYRRAREEFKPLPGIYLLATFWMVIAFFVRNFSDDFFVDDSALLFWLLSGASLAITRASE
jgi:O-antigen ligase